MYVCVFVCMLTCVIVIIIKEEDFMNSRGSEGGDWEDVEQAKAGVEMI